MSLPTAFNVISSSFAANAAQTAIVSNNIANVNTPSYSREIANVVTNAYGGADVDSITREANAALLEQVSSSTSQAAAQQATSLRYVRDEDSCLQALMVFDINIAIVIGPTPPGTGVMAPAISDTASKSTSPTSL